MARVLLDGVTKRFGNVVAVNDVDLEVKDKEFVVLVGPSGCGKSTTLRMIAGLEEITKELSLLGTLLSTTFLPKTETLPWYSKTMLCIPTWMFIITWLLV